MAIDKKKNGKYLVDMLDEHRKRVQRTFNKMADARAFERKVDDKKYLRKMLGLSLAKLRYPIAQALDDFANTKADLRSKSKQKYDGVINEIRNFININQIHYVDQFSPDYASVFFNLLIAEKKSDKGNIVKAKPRTINFYIQVLKSFFRYEMLKGHIEKDPTIHLKNVKIEKQRPDYFTIIELNLFFEQDMIPQYRNAFWGLVSTGMRFSELSHLTWEDIDFQNRLIIVRSKDNFLTKTFESDRKIPMLKNLYLLLKHIQEQNFSDTYVFCNTKGMLLSERSLLEVCKRISTKAGIGGRSYLHKFRHTFATHLIQRGVSIETIQMFLGHSSIVQTQQYAHNKPDHLHQQVNVLNDIVQFKKGLIKLSSTGEKRDKQRLLGRSKSLN